MTNGRLLLLLLALTCCGCTAVIVPPKTNGNDLAPVLVTDYGYHSTIIVPQSDGRLVEYAYGDWTFFGQNQKSLLSGLHALLASDQATLGRRVLDLKPDPSAIKRATGAKTVLKFQAARDKVAELGRDLDCRYSAQLDSVQYSEAHHLYFVKDDEPYGLLHNCNHFTAEWLKHLGCRVDGPTWSSKFRLQEDEMKEEEESEPAVPRS